jgi:hypothetical protein
MLISGGDLGRRLYVRADYASLPPLVRRAHVPLVQRRGSHEARCGRKGGLAGVRVRGRRRRMRGEGLPQVSPG